LAADGLGGAWTPTEGPVCRYGYLALAPIGKPTLASPWHQIAEEGGTIMDFSSIATTLLAALPPTLEVRVSTGLVVLLFVIGVIWLMRRT